MPVIGYADELLDVTAVLGYEFTRRSRNVVHELIDNPVPAVTLRPAASRSGSMTLFFESKADAIEGARIHGLADVLYVYDDAHPELAMNYVVAGDVVHAQDPDTMRRWTVTVPFREVQR